MARIIKAPNVRLEKQYNVVERERVLQHAEDEAAALLQAVQQEADHIREMANQEAAALQQAAQSEMEDMRNQARAEIDQAREEAREQGFNEGLQQGQAEARKQVESSLQALKSMMAEGQQILEGMFRDQETEIRALVADVVSRVIQETVETDNELVTRVARACIHEAADRKNLRILVHPEDREMIEQWSETLSTLFDDIEKITIEDDGRVGKGGVMIETASGGVDGRIDKQTDIYKDTITDS